MKKKHKRILIGIAAFIPVTFISLSFLIAVVIIKITGDTSDIENILQTLLLVDDTSDIGNVFHILLVVARGMMSIGIAFAIFDGIGFFIFNILNNQMPHDKKVGWGYMLLIINIVAVPAYWYNFIWKRRY